MTLILLGDLDLARVHELVSKGIFPVADCPTCSGKRPVNIVQTHDGVWVASCPNCRNRLDSVTVEFRDRAAMREIGFDVGPAGR